jgi:RND family efflux transporter MFP subunit
MSKENTMKRKKSGKRRVWIAVAALAVTLAGGGVFYHRANASAALAEETPAVQTAKVRTGDLVISTTGSGTLVPSAEVELGFANGGELVEVAAYVGDTVAAGQVLARIDDLDARKALASAEAQVAQTEQALDVARLNHEELIEPPSDADVLEAQAQLKLAVESLSDLRAGPTASEIAEAEAALVSAQEAYQALLEGPDADEVQRLELSLSQASNNLWSAQMNRDAKGSDRDKDSGAYDQAQASVYNAEIAVQVAELALREAQEPAAEAELKEAQAAVARAQDVLDELAAGASEADLAQAEAQVAQAGEQLDELLAGPSQSEVEVSEAEVAHAELSLTQALLALEAAQQDLEDTVLVAPITGTVTAVEGQVGERASTTSFLTIADAASPLLQIYVDESDMDMLAVGNEVRVEFDAVRNQLFAGHVIQVDPALVTEDGVQVVRGLVALDEGQAALPDALLMGMTASVEVIAGKAEGALLVPVEALREPSPGEYAVFVMEEGRLTLRPVEVGLQDYTYAQILSGLLGGETVTTGVVEVK